MPEKVERDFWIITPTPIVLAVNDLGLRRMHLKSAHFQPRPRFDPEGFGFPLVPAMRQAVVSMATPWKVRAGPRHPEVKRMAREEIGWDWADHAPLRGSSCPLDYFSVSLH
jgi:hypothetical protein